MDKWETTANYDKVMETRKWLKHIPILIFPSDWGIKMSPPFLGATVRFRVYKGIANVSVYLDCYDNLGVVGEPYWEVHPYEGDTFRCGIEDTNELIEAINESIKQQNEKFGCCSN